MDRTAIFIQLLVAGFFGVACLRARVPAAAGLPPTFRNFLCMPPRLERLRRSRWQWIAMVAFIVVLGLQRQLPLAIVLMVTLDFALFLALPARASAAAPQ